MRNGSSTIAFENRYNSTTFSTFGAPTPTRPSSAPPAPTEWNVLAESTTRIVDTKPYRGRATPAQSNRNRYLPPKFTTLPLSATPANRPPAPHTYSDSLVVATFL